MENATKSHTRQVQKLCSNLVYMSMTVYCHFRRLGFLLTIFFINNPDFILLLLQVVKLCFILVLLKSILWRKHNFPTFIKRHNTQIFFTPFIDLRTDMYGARALHASATRSLLSIWRWLSCSQHWGNNSDSITAWLETLANVTTPAMTKYQFIYNPFYV